MYLWLPVLYITFQWLHPREWRRVRFFWNSLQSSSHPKVMDLGSLSQTDFRDLTSPIPLREGPGDLSQGAHVVLNPRAFERDRKPDPYNYWSSWRQCSSPQVPSTIKEKGCKTPRGPHPSHEWLAWARGSGSLPCLSGSSVWRGGVQREGRIWSDEVPLLTRVPQKETHRARHFVFLFADT